MANTSFNNNPFQALGLQNASNELGNTKATQNNKLQSPLLYKPYGACGTVTGSAHFIHHTLSDKYFAIDCGLLQGEGEEDANGVNQLPVEPKDLHAIFLTHAHADHVGNLLQWMRAGFRGKIYCTEITAKLTDISLRDSLRHLDRLEDDQLDEMLELLPKLFVCPDTDSNAKYGHLYEIEGATGLRYAFTPTSHLIGCVAIRLLTSGYGQPQTDIVFSGDVGPVIDAHSHGGLAPARQYPTAVSGVVVAESTYGDKGPRDPSTLQAEERLNALAKVIHECVAKGPDAQLIIPAFSLGRTTDLLADLFLVLTSKRNLTGIPEHLVPTINIDSSLAMGYAVELRDAYTKQKGNGVYSWFNSESQFNKFCGLPLLQQLLSPDTEPYQEHKTAEGNLVVNWGSVKPGDCVTIIIAGSGTTIRGKVCEEIIEQAKNPRATVLLCGYCPDNSLGGHLREILNEKYLAKRYEMDPLKIPKHNKKKGGPDFIEIAADAVRINLADLSKYYSGHADSNSIKHFIENMKKPANMPLHLILVHGSDKARSVFSTELKNIVGKGAVHCPSAKYPWFDIENKLWLFSDLGELRSSISLSTLDKNGETPSVTYVAKRITHCLLKNYFDKGFELPMPRIQLENGEITFPIRGPSKIFFHKVLIKKDSSRGFCIQVDSLLGDCQTNEEFKLRCFPWEAVVRTLNKNIQFGYNPSATLEEVAELKKLVEVETRDYPVLIVTKLGEDNECAKFLAKSLMLDVGPVRLVTMEGRKLSRAQGLGISAGEGLFYDNQPGCTPIKFSILNPLDSAPAILACLNRIEDERRRSAA